MNYKPNVGRAQFLLQQVGRDVWDVRRYLLASAFPYQSDNWRLALTAEIEYAPKG